MIYFLRRGEATVLCETRLNPEGPGFQLVVTENGQARIEDYIELPPLLAREHELLSTLRAHGWHDRRPR